MGFESDEHLAAEFGSTSNTVDGAVENVVEDADEDAEDYVETSED